MKTEVINVEKICEHGKRNGIKVSEMSDCLGISRQRLHQFRKYNDKISAIDFLKLCELCLVDLAEWKNYVKEIDLEKEARTKREKEKLKT